MRSEGVGSSRIGHLAWSETRNGGMTKIHLRQAAFLLRVIRGLDPRLQDDGDAALDCRVTSGNDNQRGLGFTTGLIDLTGQQWVKPTNDIIAIGSGDERRG